MTSLDKSVLLLFPRPGLGKALVEEYRRHEYRIILILSTDKEEHFYKDIFANENERINVLSLQESAVALWNTLDNKMKDRITQAQTVINCIGYDFISLQVEGEGEDWRIRASELEQKRFAFLDLLLKNFKVVNGQLWINLVYGKAGQPDKQTFCDTRYGIMGFSNVMKMIPELSGMQIMDICLTYLRHKSQPGRTRHCERCSAEKFLEDAPNLDSPEAIAQFVFKQVSIILK